MNEKPLERLNYFNGQRLQAGDFKLEQDYHMRVRRWLNRSLYKPGIAMGLEVYPVPGAKPLAVRVHPGLAIDHLGREIILLEPKDVPVMHDIAQPKGMKGSYLVIRYREELLAKQDACCAPTGSSDERSAQGGPSRVIAEPVVECVPDLPHEASGKILLGRIELAKDCGSIASIDYGVRRYTGQASASNVRQYAVEGFRDLSPGNDAAVTFHIRGHQPSSVTLYLRAEIFPSYHYTELGTHRHSVSIAFEPHSVPAHQHSLGSATTNDDTHDHVFHANTGGWFPDILQGSRRGDALAIAFRDGNPKGTQAEKDVWARHTLTDLSSSGGSLGAVARIEGDTHHHGFSATQTTGANNPVALPHTPSIGSSPLTGAAGASTAAMDGAALTYLDSFEIWIDGVPCTNNVLSQIQRTHANPSAWTSLGNGTSGHPLVLEAEGTGPLQLDLLPGISIGPGQHRIEFKAPQRVGKRNGGRILYNLYVE